MTHHMLTGARRLARRRSRIALASAAAVLGTLLAGGPATAATGPDVAVSLVLDSPKPGAPNTVLGGAGRGWITNTGDTTLPAGVSVYFTVRNLAVPPLICKHGDSSRMCSEIHAVGVLGGDGTAAVPAPVIDNAVPPWVIITTRDLAPGEAVTYRWSVGHYAPWHRVAAVASVSSLPAGVTDVDQSNDTATVARQDGTGF
ncbi:hypothetical protein V2S66_24400 [Streptomyces sp. V4-01]|uniref:Uncharacterized protein n=1 Tax=Actinacidiphila polyblastidii TaxID=3110430 RepID=A0ABU7PH56_9ACTN|nr:hypothetical protein [Streptomyces sp. V4-01]